MYKPLIQIGYWRQSENDSDTLPWPIEGESRLPLETKQKITKYLDNGKLHAAYRGWSTCRICGTMNGSTCLTDGEFVYPEGYSHYILDHGVNPDSRLLAKVLSI